METKVIKYFFVFLPLVLLTVGFNEGIPKTFGADKAGAQDIGNTVEFKTVYPNVYDANEQKVIDMVRRYLTGTPEELANRIKAAKAGEKQAGNMELNSGLVPVEDYTPGNTDVISAAYNLNLTNPLYSDTSYAKKTGYGALIAAPLAVSINVGFPYLPKLSDAWLWTRIDEGAANLGGLDHELTFYRPIYASDTLYSIITRQDFVDITDPKGSKVRKFRVIGEGEMYNQKGEKVMSIYHSGIEKFQIFKDPSMAAGNETPSTGSTKVDWGKMRPIHKYTETDWEYIKELWSKEYMRGSDTLYWEDVKIGDEPAWTCDGPVTEEDRWSGGGGGGVQKSTTVRDVLTASATENQPSAGGPPMGGRVELTQDSYGMYHIESGQTGGLPPSVSNSADKHPNQRSSFMNTQGRDFAVRMVTNWMGDDGWLYKICWRLSGDTDHDHFPADFDRPSYLLKVPYLKEGGKFMNVHGMVGDVGITKGYVCDKYMKDGRHYVDLVLWCETIEGDIWAELYAIVELPSKGAKE